MPVTSYLLASCPEYFLNFHVASRAPEVETSWASQPQDSVTFAAVDTHDSRTAKRESLLRGCGLTWCELSVLKAAPGKQSGNRVLRAMCFSEWPAGPTRVTPFA